MIPHLKGDVGDLGKAVALVEPLCAKILGIDAEQHCIMATLVCYTQRPIHQLRADAVAGVTGQCIKLAELDWIGRVGIFAELGGITQLAEGDEPALMLDQPMGTFLAGDFGSDSLRVVYLGKEGGEVFGLVEVAEGGDEGLGPQLRKRAGIGEGGGAGDHGFCRSGDRSCWKAGETVSGPLHLVPMKKLLALIALALMTQPAHAEDAPKWSIAIHGGAGTLDPKAMTPEKRAEYEAALQKALDAGAKVLADGGSAMDAVKAAIIPMEDSPLFNAGKGAVFTWEGTNELDASIMDGRDRSAGAVAGVKTVKNPILLADKVRTDSEHVFLMGAGAEAFALEKGFVVTPPEYFATEARLRALERMKANKLSALDVDHKFGTVGAVALDQSGNLAAGTSTGGMTGKRWGRVGDAPVIGAGTYADNRACAVSATGWGEYFLRVGVAHEICARLRAANEIKTIMVDDDDTEPSVQADEAQYIADAVMADVKQLGGDGGVILVTPEGHALYSFNTTGMYRGRATSAGVREVAIFGGEEKTSNTPDH